jgi:hypothetical protein
MVMNIEMRRMERKVMGSAAHHRGTEVTENRNRVHHRGTEVTEESSLFFIAAERSAMKKQLACGCVNLAAGSVASAYGFSTHGDDVNIPIGVPQLPYRRWSTRGRAKTPNS